MILQLHPEISALPLSWPLIVGFKKGKAPDLDFEKLQLHKAKLFQIKICFNADRWFCTWTWKWVNFHCWPLNLGNEIRNHQTQTLSNFSFIKQSGVKSKCASMLTNDLLHLDPEIIADHQVLTTVQLIKDDIKWICPLLKMSQKISLKKKCSSVNEWICCSWILKQQTQGTSNFSFTITFHLTFEMKGHWSLQT